MTYRQLGNEEAQTTRKSALGRIHLILPLLALSIGVVVCFETASPPQWAGNSGTTALRNRQVAEAELAASEGHNALFWIMLVLAIIFYTATTLACSAAVYGWRSMLRTIMLSISLVPSQPQDDKGTCLKLCAEVLLDQMWFPVGLATGITAGWALGSNKVPPGAMMLLVPVAVRGMMAQKFLAGESLRDMVRKDFTEFKGLPSFPVILGILGIIDGAQHGLMAAGAFLEDSQVHAAFLTGWQTGAAAFFRPLVATFHIGGCMVVAWVISFLWTLGMVALQNADNDEPPLDKFVIASSLVGFNAVRSKFANTMPSKDILSAAIAVTLVKFIGETLVFLECQTSLAMAEGTKFTHDYTTACGLVLSVVVGFKQASDLARATYDYIHEGDRDAADLKILSIMSVVVLLVVVCGESLMLIRICMTFYCPNHRWGISTGCV